MEYHFGTKDLEKCLLCLGFTSRPAKASHKKFDCPKYCEVPERLRPFIIVVLGKKQYDDISAAKWIKQIKNFGFTNKQISHCLN